MSHIPNAALAGVTAYVGVCLLDGPTWKRLPAMRRVDASAFVVTVAAVLLFNPVGALAAGSAVYIWQWATRRLVPWRQLLVHGMKDAARQSS